MAQLTRLAAPEQNGSAFSRSSNQLISGALYIADIAGHGNKYVIRNPKELISSLNEVPAIPATPTSPEENRAGRETPHIIASSPDYEAGSNGMSTARNLAAAKLKVVGALLVLVGAVFTLL